MGIHTIRIDHLKRVNASNELLITEHEEHIRNNMNALMVTTKHDQITFLSDNTRERRKSIERLKKEIEANKKELAILEKSNG